MLLQSAQTRAGLPFPICFKSISAKSPRVSAEVQYTLEKGQGQLSNLRANNSIKKCHQLWYTGKPSSP